MGNFHDAMLYKLKSLKSCSVPRTVRKEKLNVEEKDPFAEKTFKYLKNTPEVRQKLEFINKLDEEINETISRYKAEREKRLSTEFEMCRNMANQKLQQERDTEIFLQMCNFRKKTENLEWNHMEQNRATECTEPTENHNEEINSKVGKENDLRTETFHEQNEPFACPMNFIRKNIYAAKEGMMAGFSLTDEEKAKIAEILKDIDDFQLNDTVLESSSICLEETLQPDNTKNKQNYTENQLVNEVNAFSVMENDRIRMGEIDHELEKFEDDEKLITINKNITVIKDEEFWKKYVLEQSLKEIDMKLEKLYASYLEDDEKLKNSKYAEEEEESQIEDELLKEEIDNCT